MSDLNSEICNSRSHFNCLTPAQAERLAMLAEECGEVIQIIGKILRHGYESYHPDQQSTPPAFRYTNRKALGDELTDLFSVASSLYRDGVQEGSLHDLDRAWVKKLRYAHHQEELAHE